jgi:hypothetical protein
LNDRQKWNGLSRASSFSWIACASPAYLNARGAPATPYELSAHDHVGFRNPASGQILTWRFADPRGKGPVRVAPKPKHICDDAHASLALIANGSGVGWGPAWLVHEDLRTGRLVEVLAPWRAPAEPLWMLRTSARPCARSALCRSSPRFPPRSATRRDEASAVSRARGRRVGREPLGRGNRGQTAISPASWASARARSAICRRGSCRLPTTIYMIRAPKSAQGVRPLQNPFLKS